MIQALAEKIVEYYLDGEGVDKDIKKSAEWAVKYFNTANEGNCTCPFCSPFRAMKKLAKYFIETPQEELIKLYDDDREKAAQVIFEFGLACEHSPVNISITLDVISIAADMIGEYCRKEILEHLANNYEKLYQEAKAGSERMQEDEGERILKDIGEALNNYYAENDENYMEGDVTIEYDDGGVEFEHHDANYYKCKAIHFQIKLTDLNKLNEE